MPPVCPSLAQVSHTSQGETAEGLSFETAGKWGGEETIDGGEEALAEVEREETSLAAAPRLPGYQLVGRCWAQHQRFWNLPARDCMAASCKGHIDVSGHRGQAFAPGGCHCLSGVGGCPSGSWSLEGVGPLGRASP